MIIISLIIQRNLAKKIQAKWESSLITVQLKWDPPAVSEIHENVDLVLGIKNIFELEGIINSRESCFSFLNRSIPFFSKDHVIWKCREQRFVKIGGPFIDEMPGIVIVKMLEKKAQITVILKLNSATLEVTNISLETVIFNPKEILSILDIRSMGNYKIKYSI